MKNLLLMLALSLTMIACDKEEENINMFDWDNIATEMQETELSAMDVLKSLQDNEYWGENIVYYYFEKDDKIVESLKLGNGLELESGITIYRFADDFIHIYENIAPNMKYIWSLSIKEDNGLYSCYYKEKLHFEFKVVAYDEKQILIEMNYPEEFRFSTEEGKFLSKKMLIKRQASDSKWWEKAQPVGQE